MDEQEEMEGQFNLQALVKKVEEHPCPRSHIIYHKSKGLKRYRNHVESQRSHGRNRRKDVKRPRKRVGVLSKQRVKQCNQSKAQRIGIGPILAGQDVDSDDGLHDIAKPKKKKAKKEKAGRSGSSSSRCNQPMCL